MSTETAEIGFLGAISAYHILAGIIIVGIVIYLIYQNVRTSVTDLAPMMLQLRKRNYLSTPDVVTSTVLQQNGSTVMGFFMIQPGDRTVHQGGDFTPLLYIDGNWWLEVARTRTGDHASTQLRVQTNQAGSFITEYIELPPIPNQKWICITVLRDGRRFDVLYDSRIVASKQLDYYPVAVTNSLSVGDPSITGKAIHIVIASYRMTPDEVDIQRSTFVTTTGEVMEDNSIITSLPTIRFFGKCIPGLPCTPITKPPVNSNVEWSTSYA